MTLHKTHHFISFELWARQEQKILKGSIFLLVLRTQAETLREELNQSREEAAETSRQLELTKTEVC